MQHPLTKITQKLLIIIVGALAHCVSCRADQDVSVSGVVNGGEGGTSASFLFSRNFGASGTTRFYLSWGGSASFSDFGISLPTYFDLWATTSDYLTIPVYDDSIYEGTETLSCYVSWAENLNDFSERVSVFPNYAEVAIYDNDKPTVTVSKISDAGEYYQTKGKFRISRTGSTASSLSVSWSMSGTAIPYPNSGTDYINEISALTGGTIAAGNTYVDMDINPTRDLVPEGTETVVLTLSSSSNYNIGSPSSATVNIND